MATLNLNTKMQIGYKFEIALNNGFKIMAAKNRQIIVTVENDLYNVWAFTLKGVNMVDEKKINGVFASELDATIIKSAKI